MKELKQGLYNVFLALSGILYVLGIYLNYLEFREINKRISAGLYADKGYDFYILLTAKQDLYYSLTWLIVFSVLFVMLAYFTFKKRQSMTTILGVSVYALLGLSVLIYKIMTGFR